PGIDIFGILFAPENLADNRRVAELDPQSYHALGMLALAEVFAERAEGRIKPASDPGDKGKAGLTLTDCLARLEKLTQSRDPRIAGGSSAILGSICFLREDTKAAEKHFRRTVALEPTNQNAWDFLMGLLAMSKDPDLVPVSLERLKHQDDAYSRYLLAKS